MYIFCILHFSFTPKGNNTCLVPSEFGCFIFLKADPWIKGQHNISDARKGSCIWPETTEAVSVKTYRLTEMHRDGDCTGRPCHGTDYALHIPSQPPESLE